MMRSSRKTSAWPFRLRAFHMSLVAAALLLPSAAWSQITYTGAAATQNFGSVAIGSTSAAQTFSFSVAAGTTVGSIGVVTQGAPNLDFTEASGSTCTTTTYTSTTTCTVKATFTPREAGLRQGAVVFFSGVSNTGTVLGSLMVYGTGTGSQIAFNSGAETPIDPSLGGQDSVAVDAAGDVFVASAFSAVEVPAGGGAPITIAPVVNGVALNNTHGLAVDGAGNLFIGDYANSRIVKVPAGGGTATAISPIVNGYIVEPIALAVDGAGDLFVADAYIASVVEVPAEGGAPFALDTSAVAGLSYANSVAVDSAGDVFISDLLNDRIVEVPAGGGAATVAASELSCPRAVAVDAAGILYALVGSCQSYGSTLVEIPPGGTQVVINPNFGSPGLAIDGAGDLFSTASTVVELPRSQAPTLNFPTSTSEGSLDTTDGTQTVQIANIGTASLTLTALSFPADFLEVSGDPSACAASTSLSPGQQCDVPVEFAPEHSGALSESVALTDNAENVSGAVQSIGLTGTGLADTGVIHFSITTSTSTIYGGAPFSITVTALNSRNLIANRYSGTVNFTSSDSSFVNPGPLTLSAGTGQATVTLRTTGSQTITATDSVTSSWKGSATFAVNYVTHFSVTSTAVVVGFEPFSITVTALDSANQTVPSYNGTVNFTSSDPGFVNPGPLTLSSGIGQATVTLETTGAQTITATDTVNSAWTGSGSFSVAGAAEFIGSSASQDFGSQAIGSVGAAQALGFSISAGTTVGSIAVVTQGSTNLDFVNAAGSTCAAQAYAADTTCTVNVTFTPRAAGLRMGAVVFFAGANNSGTVLGSVRIFGIGTGPQIAYSPSTAIEITSAGDFETSVSAWGVALDGAGDVFITEEYCVSPVFPPCYSYAMGVAEVPAGGGAATFIDPTVNGAGLNYPAGLALDSLGDLFIGDTNNNRVVEVPAGGGTPIAINPTVNGEGLNGPFGVAVDSVGDLFIADSLNNRVVQVPAGGGVPTAIDPTVNGEGLSAPYGVTVDGAGDLFIADANNSRVVEVPAGGGEPIAIDPTVAGTGLRSPKGVAVDGRGDLFIADTHNDRVVEVPTGGGAAIAIGPELSAPTGLVMDGAGDLFISGATGDSLYVMEVQRSQPPATIFPTATDVGSTDTADGTQTVQLLNIGNEALLLTALIYPADFPEASGDASACTSSTSLIAGQQCDLPISFTPHQSGNLSENVTLTDNALNVTGTQQSINVSGIAKGADHFSITTTATVHGYIPFPITITALSSSNEIVTSYDGTVALTSSDPGFVNPGPLTLSGGTGQAAVSLSTAGTQTITASDTVTPALTGTGSFSVPVALATLTSPTPGSTITGPSVRFTWTPGTGVTEYDLSVGSTGVGSNNIFNTGWRNVTSWTATGLPTNGETLYVRLSTNSNGTFAYYDYTYTALTTSAATLTSPAPGATFTYASIPFTWTSVPGATSYNLSLGTTGVGSNNLFNTGYRNVTSWTVTGLPATHETIYARLSTNFNGAIVYNDYTYTNAGTPATITSPTAGSTIGGSVTFTWSPGAGVTKYDILVGSSPGSGDFYNSGAITGTSATVNIPLYGGTVYVRLLSEIGGNWQATYSTFTAQ